MSNIDYSAIPTPSTSSAQEDWEPPIHKYFGKKLPNGRMEPEPVYKFQAFPSFRYGLVNGVLSARMVTSEAQAKQLGPDWSDTPGTFGHIGAPDFDTALEMQRAEGAKESADEAPRRGRPPKVAA